MVPHLTTALAVPLQDLERTFLEKMPEIERWLRGHWQDHAVPFYTSVDVRNAGFKLAPVDTNLFPAGFNNLNPDFWPLCIQAAQAAVEKICPDARGVLLIPESHTRNTFYLQNLATLVTILRHAGLRVRVGSLMQEIRQATRIDLPNGGEVTLEPVARAGNRLRIGDFEPCMILLNNDLSAGLPAVLRGIEQPIAPPVEAGWYHRRKSHHFAMYDRIVESLAGLIGADPWLLDPYFAVCGEVDFQQRRGEECLASNVDELLARVRAKYHEYGIREKPFAVVKADAGTYGMGIMTVRSPDEVRNLNRKTRNKMAVGKEGMAVTDVIIQEGVYTFESINEAIAEPVVYMVDRFVVGGFYRVHTSRGKDENLNAPGAQFVPLAFESPCIPDLAGAVDCPPNRFYAYGVIGRLAQAAASLEIEELVEATDDARATASSAPMFEARPG